MPRNRALDCSGNHSGHAKVPAPAAATCGGCKLAKSLSAWTLPVTLILVAAVSTTAAVIWAVKASLSHQNSALVIGLATFIGAFFSATVLVRALLFRGRKQPRPERIAESKKPCCGSGRCRND